MIGAVLRWFTSTALDRALSVVDRKLANDIDRDKLKADIIKEHYRTRADFMRAGGFILMALFAVPLAFWWAAVLVYSVFWCAGCAYPKDWTIAMIPGALAEWAGLMIIAVFGVVGVHNLRR